MCLKYILSALNSKLWYRPDQNCIVVRNSFFSCTLLFICSYPYRVKPLFLLFQVLRCSVHPCSLFISLSSTSTSCPDSDKKQAFYGQHLQTFWWPGHQNSETLIWLLHPLLVPFPPAQQRHPPQCYHCHLQCHRHPLPLWWPPQWSCRAHWTGRAPTPPQHFESRPLPVAEMLSVRVLCGQRYHHWEN